MPLNKGLQEIKNREGYTDLEMAERIGCSRALFQMIRAGKASIELNTLRGIVKAFPELIGDAYIFLFGDAQKLAIVADASSERHQRTPGLILRGFGGRLRELVTRFFSTDISIGDKHSNEK